MATAASIAFPRDARIRAPAAAASGVAADTTPLGLSPLQPRKTNEAASTATTLRILVDLITVTASSGISLAH
jgi:hypothetical protein